MNAELVALESPNYWLLSSICQREKGIVREILSYLSIGG